MSDYQNLSKIYSQERLHSIRTGRLITNDYYQFGKSKQRITFYPDGSIRAEGDDLFTKAQSVPHHIFDGSSFDSEYRRYVGRFSTV